MLLQLSLSLPSSSRNNNDQSNEVKTAKTIKSLDRSLRNARLKCCEMQRHPSFTGIRNAMLLCLFLCSCVLWLPQYGFDPIKTDTSKTAGKNFGLLTYDLEKRDDNHNFIPCVPSLMGTTNEQQQQQQQQRHQGIIVSSLQGRLGNNIFEIGFAHALAKQLCWPIVYRYHWAPTFHDPNVFRCFPNVDMTLNFQNASRTSTSNNNNNSQNNHTTSASLLRHDLNLSLSVWNSMTHLTKDGAERQSQIYYEFLSQHSDRVFSCPHMECDFHNVTSMAETVLSTRTKNNQHYQVVNLAAFFILYDWIQKDDSNGSDTIALLRHVFSINNDCCITPPPPEDAVVIHIRNFQDGDHGIKNVPWNVSVYESIVEKYYTSRSTSNSSSSSSSSSIWPIVWVVCEPHTIQTPLVQDLQYGKLQAKVFPGVTPVDAHCILQRAKRLILSTCSTFSQSAALLASTTATTKDVHYPTYTAHHPKVTLKVPGWKYHLIAHYYDSAKHEIVEWDINHTKLEVLPG